MVVRMTGIVCGKNADVSTARNEAIHVYPSETPRKISSVEIVQIRKSKGQLVLSVKHLTPSGSQLCVRIRQRVDQ